MGKRGKSILNSMGISSAVSLPPVGVQLVIKLDLFFIFNWVERRGDLEIPTNWRREETLWRVRRVRGELELRGDDDERG